VAKVYQQAQLVARGMEIIEHLGAMLVGQFTHGFDFEDHLFIADKIWDEMVFQGSPAVSHRELWLDDYRQTEKNKFDL
jgi:hypothetical protein